MNKYFSIKKQFFFVSLDLKCPVNGSFTRKRMCEFTWTILITKIVRLYFWINFHKLNAFTLEDNGMEHADIVSSFGMVNVFIETVYLLVCRLCEFWAVCLHFRF